MDQSVDKVGVDPSAASTPSSSSEPLPLWNLSADQSTTIPFPEEAVLQPLAVPSSKNTCASAVISADVGISQLLADPVQMTVSADFVLPSNTTTTAQELSSSADVAPMHAFPGMANVDAGPGPAAVTSIPAMTMLSFPAPIPSVNHGVGPTAIQTLRQMCLS